MKKKKPTKRAKPAKARAKKKAATVKSELKHAAWHLLEMEQVSPLFRRHFVYGESVMLARIMLKKGCIVPMHQHHNEQVSFVFDGTLKFTFEDKEVVMNGGEVLVIPANLPHKAEAITDTLAFDIFSPPRTDWISKSDQYLRRVTKEAKTPRKVG